MEESVGEKISTHPITGVHAVVPGRIRRTASLVGLIGQNVELLLATRAQARRHRGAAARARRLIAQNLVDIFRPQQLPGPSRKRHVGMSMEEFLCLFPGKLRSKVGALGPPRRQHESRKHQDRHEQRDQWQSIP